MERAAMMGPSIGVIERAFELARQSTTVEEITVRLKREGYSSVDAHLMGRKIRFDLVKAIRCAI
jgi:hypothetical protein